MATKDLLRTAGESIRRSLFLRVNQGNHLRTLHFTNTNSIETSRDYDNISWPSTSRSMSSSSDAPAATAEAITLTDSCVRRLKDIQSEEGESENLMLRLSVDGGGCSGFQYSFTLDTQMKPEDKVFERDGMKLLVDDLSFSFVRGATIDYSQELIRSAFHVIANPNASSACGCGASFSAK
eukprot:TRINITY_DN22317_c0_g1_i1.p1 TRINITY_DN22317_c0_g1~~TRINITY_DN22317_c0_g1_i1.p1  ORF type:complete len:180 (+),score=24.54 TRINITY_DN22317_c0_g1_i1:35-574(+)